MALFYHPLLFQKLNNDEKSNLKIIFEKKERTEKDLKDILNLMKKNNIINECYSKAEYFINLASNSLSVFENSKEKEIFKKLTSFSLERNF